MASAAEVAAMRRALDLARSPGVPRGPNPRVGCVLLDATGAIVAEGYHRGAGGPHAEVDALVAAGGRARGATAVVTLEPCNHLGRTGPCAEALIAAGIVRVVFGQHDANPVARGGAEAFRAAGVDVEGGVLADEARTVNPTWTFAVEHGRPFVTWKFAATLDGRSAAADGTSRWITSPEARADVHRLRAECDVVLVGTGTVLADDPRLTVRGDDDTAVQRAVQPLRAVMGLRSIPARAAVLDEAAETVHLATRSPERALRDLFVRDRQHVWLEGGPTLAGAFVHAGVVDRVVAYLAPALLGAGPAALADAGVTTVSRAVRLDIDDVTRVGSDLRITARPEKG
ncbi:MAG TPA: bifunctional diaminohydroxyphosphoribosylaminopyrimidine deaminase/5-amino-6-(5-phosphoribosylamino)uracil reductase RibD [Jiangellaceae bacterium]|jgi:diaminohydroxyphosphoribosylaminopyrimidine deaminase/5-amino-6-(5-phosphoribosylamino)uracil reductase|nr:bifunctional diaminohydroxyphosphoribosylaminopyrimidine deaminase/5-amino-6-(5-phosphoribosylamino)uracil reductase RibD [Jiangellaceae bacterium]